MRTFTFKVLKDFGFGKRSIEWKIQEETRYMMEEIRTFQGRPLNPSHIFMKGSCNILCSVISGDRYDYSDEKFSKLLQNVEQMISLMSNPWGQAQSVFPTLMHYIPGPHHGIIPCSEEIVKFASEVVKSCQETFDPNDLRHLTDHFLIKMEKDMDDPNTEFNMRNLLMTIHNLFVAGTETITTTMQHALLILLRYPEIEGKLQEEIERVIGQSRMPAIEDKANMPYMQAVLDEMQRFSDIGPYSLPHMTTKDTMFRGFFIPKGTDVFPLLCTVHRDPTKFATPNKFNPNHFLDENGKFQKNDACLPFSAGKRYCPGDNVARMELFIFLATILQNFNLSFERELTDDDIAPRLTGFANSPAPYELSFIPR